MKNIYTLLITLFVFTFSNAQIVDIPDVDFKNALVNHDIADFDGDGEADGYVDSNNDGEIQVTEAEAVLGLVMGGFGIHSLEGIQSFININNLTCLGNQLTSLDVSSNLNLRYLNCKDNLISSLIIPQELDLEYLLCYQNQITSLDVSHYENLIRLSCGTNPIENLDVTQNPYLEHLGCGGSLLTSLDVTQNPNLKKLFFWENQINSINLSQNPNLERMQADYNLLTSLDVTNSPLLTDLGCFNNQIETLDFSQNPNLVYLYCHDNLLTSFNIKNNNNTSIIGMTAQNNPNLFCIQVDDIDYAINQSCDDDNWCKDDWAEYSEECELGLEDNNVISFTIYPNPVQDVLFLDSPQQIESVKIYSLHGKLIKEDISNSVDVSQLITGLYFVQVTIDGKTSTKKFIKN